MELPELVLVHGAWHGAWAWQRLLPVLEERGWSATAVDLPSSGGKAGISDDAEVVRAALEATATPKVLVGHSYGGTVITVGGAGVENLVGLVYLCGARPQLGDRAWADPRDPDAPAMWEIPDWVKVDVEKEAIYVDQTETILFNDCSPEVVAFAQSRLKPQSLASFIDPVTAVAWQERPSAYLITELDNCVPAEQQEQLADGAEYIERLAASHSPYLSRPEDVEEFLRRAVAKF
jgi:pimeloyl-ACP methyl ester carboxylesterase